MTEKEEKAYMRGCREPWKRILAEAARELGYDTPEGKLAALINEREQAVAALRDVCEAYGSNDWPDNLHLADIIEKHLGRPLDDELGRR